MRILHCQSTAFSEGMVDDGYGDVVNIDISSVVIEAMQNKYRDRSQLKCILNFSLYILGYYLKSAPIPVHMRYIHVG